MTFFTFYGFKHPPVPKSVLMHPNNAPRTAKEFPKDFHGYLYVGPAIETVFYKGMRRRALVARLINEYHSKSGAVVQQEMTASLSDLRDSMHPETRKTAKALRAYYEAHVVEKQNVELDLSGSKLKNAAHSPATA